MPLLCRSNIGDGQLMKSAESFSVPPCNTKVAAATALASSMQTQRADQAGLQHSGHDRGCGGGKSPGRQRRLDSTSFEGATGSKGDGGTSAKVMKTLTTLARAPHLTCHRLRHRWREGRPSAAVVLECAQCRNNPGDGQLMKSAKSFSVPPRSTKLVGTATALASSMQRADQAGLQHNSHDRGCSTGKSPGRQQRLVCPDEEGTPVLRKKDGGTSAKVAKTLATVARALHLSGQNWYHRCRGNQAPQSSWDARSAATTLAMASS
jgi:hypothetical protein